MTVRGMLFSSPDSLVAEMVELYGGKMVSPHAVKENYKKGPFQGKYNGVKHYKGDMSSKVQLMGTYHLLDDTRIRVHYPGNKNTCARCHQFPFGCPGGEKQSSVRR